MLSVKLSWFMRCKAFSISLSRPSKLEDRLGASFFDLGLRVGECEFISRSRAARRRRSCSFSVSSSSTRSSADGSGSS